MCDEPGHVASDDVARETYHRLRLSKACPKTCPSYHSTNSPIYLRLPPRSNIGERCRDVESVQRDVQTGWRPQEERGELAAIRHAPISGLEKEGKVDGSTVPRWIARKTSQTAARPMFDIYFDAEPGEPDDGVFRRPFLPVGET